MLLDDTGTTCPPRSPRHRKKRQQRRLMTALIRTFEADERVVLLGPDPLLRMVIEAHFRITPSIATCQLLVESTSLTVIAVPDRLWHKPDPMKRLLEAKRRLAQLGRNCFLLPQSALEHARENADLAYRMLEAILTGIPCQDQAPCSAALHDPFGCMANYLATGSPCAGHRL
jgi:hypothetical protein